MYYVYMCHDSLAQRADGPSVCNINPVTKTQLLYNNHITENSGTDIIGLKSCKLLVNMARMGNGYILNTITSLLHN